jgi:hypothetical protein
MLISYPYLKRIYYYPHLYMAQSFIYIGPESACGISIGVATIAARDWTNRNHKECWESVTGLTRVKGLNTRALCQKNEGSVKAKHRPVKMGGTTTYRTLSPKRASFQIGVE